MSSLVALCESAARAGGAELRAWEGRFAVREKGPADLVTDADLASQEAIRRLIAERYPDDLFVGEEAPGELARGAGSGRVWLVDPLDGTTNYAHGVPHYAVSVAVLEGPRLLAGAVFDPVAEECFTAAQGEGAALNGRPLATSDVTELREALVAASFPARVEPGLSAIGELVDLLPLCQAIRRSGSAALNLAYVAAGRFDAFWAWDLYPWDAAAGVLLVEEAGGVVSGPLGRPFDAWNPRLVAASGSPLHAGLRRVLETAPGEG